MFGHSTQQLELCIVCSYNVNTAMITRFSISDWLACVEEMRSFRLSVCWLRVAAGGNQISGNQTGKPHANTVVLSGTACKMALQALGRITVDSKTRRREAELISLCLRHQHTTRDAHKSSGKAQAVRSP
jgi:hypothetical protein